MNADLAKAAPTSASLVASFVFVDLVAFSKKSTADQFAQKQVLTAIIQSSIAVISTRDYMIKDTGDGAWMGFVANPEHALYVALAISAACRPHQRDSGLAREDLRIGVNLGAVKQTLDFESRPNFIGDGINVAKRVMDFARPGEITASRSYYDAVASLDASYPDLFAHREAGSDKHGRAHELYSIEPDMGVLEKLRAELASTAPADPGSATPATAGAPKSTARWLVPVLAIAAVSAVGAAALWLTAGGRSPAPPGASAPPHSQVTETASTPASAPGKPGKETEALSGLPAPKAVAEVPKPVAAAEASSSQASPPATSAPAADPPPVKSAAQPARARSSGADPDFLGDSDESLGPITGVPPGMPAAISKAPGGRVTAPAGSRSPGIHFPPDGGLPLPGEPSHRSNSGDLVKEFPGNGRQGPVISIQ